jgi:F-type H+-transporting ATPase subunit a
MHHIGDANVYSIGPLNIPLPSILYSEEGGLEFFSSAKFGPDLLGHGDGHYAYNKYVLHGGTIKRVTDASFPSGKVAINGFRHATMMVNDKEKDVSYVCTGDNEYLLDTKSTADAGLFGGGITSFYDFSLTKNVVSMILVCLFLFFMFRSAAKAYQKREGQAPKGVQSLLETVVVFLRDEVAKPFLGHKWEKFFPFLLTIFFFILGLNLFGQIPFFGGSNVTGNLGVTLVLAVIAFIMTNINGNGHYWKHLLVAPGVPAFVKPILIPVEIMGIFIKPLTLMLRLFANITAGHIVMVVFVGLIFIFGKSGESAVGAGGAAIGSTLLTMFMMAIELIVAFVQAFVFTILTASYIGAATEEAHH